MIDYDPMNGIGDRIKLARKAARLTQESLAAMCGWSGNSRIGNYEKGTREPNAGDMGLIASACRVRAAWLWTGEGEMIDSPILDTSGRLFVEMVPVVDFATLDGVSLGQGFDPATLATTRTLCPVQHGPRTFAFRMPDNSMACTTDQSIPAGHYVWIDPDQLRAGHDAPVLARLNGGQLLVAQYMEQAGRRWLHLLNAAYPPIPPGAGFEIAGRVIFSGRER